MMALLAFVGCSKSDGVESSQSSELRITSSITTRASGTSWDDTDEIGVYMAESGTTTYIGEENTLYTPTSGGSNIDFESENPLYYPSSGYVDILAYYPYSDAEEFDVTAYEIDVADQSKLTAIDLMIATKSGIASTSQALALNFEHKLSQINLTIKLSDGTDLDLTKMSVKLIGTSATATYDLTAGASDSPISNLGTTTEITLATNSNGTSCEAIVIPQALSGAKLLFDFESGESLAATITTTSFAIGQSYSYTAILSHAAVNLSSAEIGDWVEGNGEDGESLDARVIDMVWSEDDNSYLIYTAKGLASFANLVNGESAAYYGANVTLNDDDQYGIAVGSANGILTTDIDLSEVCGENMANWTPIGNYSNSSTSPKYSGTFNGNNKKIMNIYINASSDYQGLFGYVIGAKICNLGIVGGSIKGSSSVSGVAGSAHDSSEITNCYNTATVTGVSYVGGIAGFTNSSSIISGCYNTATVYGSGYYIGGIVGQAIVAAKITLCYSSGAVSGRYYVSGIVGRDYNNDCTISNCYYDISVSGNIGAVNSGNSGTNYCGLTTEQMKGDAETEGTLLYYLTNENYGSSDAWQADITPYVNEGYPILSWQVTVE